MSLDTLTQGLWSKVRSLAEPGKDFENVRERVSLASGAISSKYTRGAIEGPGIIDKSEEFSKIYLEATGMKFENGDKSLYSHHMRRILQNIDQEAYGRFINAIKIDDIDEALNLAKTGYMLDINAAETEATVSKVSRLGTQQMISLGQKAAELVGGNNYLAVLNDFPGYIRALKQFNTLQQAYGNH